MPPRWPEEVTEAIPYGLCHCGCGEKTKIADKNHTRSGAVKGEPRRFIRGHQLRKSPHEYVEEDRGHSSPCWIWQRATHPHGYGHLWVDGKTVQAHRHYYEKVKGPIPEGLQLDHLCRVRACVNPGHLEPVTNAENLRRGVGTTLDLEKAAEIHRARGKQRAEDLALTYGVCGETIRRIWRGEGWAEADAR